jgi:hypothetical protein
MADVAAMPMSCSIGSSALSGERRLSILTTFFS